MGRIGLPELILILAILMVVFGANRLPELGRGHRRAHRLLAQAQAQIFESKLFSTQLLFECRAHVSDP